jgi:hypothetical protein
MRLFRLLRGVPIFSLEFMLSFKAFMVSVAQLVVALGCGPSGRGFESRQTPLAVQLSVPGGFDVNVLVVDVNTPRTMRNEFGDNVL